MILRILRGLLTGLGAKLTPPAKSEADGPVERYINKLRAEFKKRRLIDPSTGKLDLRFNPLADDDHVCMPVRNRPGTYVSGVEVGDPSEELAFLEWLKERGINPPKNNVLRNDGKWRNIGRIDPKYNPMEHTEDLFIPQRNVS